VQGKTIEDRNTLKWPKRVFEGKIKMEKKEWTVLDLFSKKSKLGGELQKEVP
jgi:hypothetical protein